VVYARENFTSLHFNAVVVCGCEAMRIAKKSAAEAKRYISSVSLMQFFSPPGIAMPKGLFYRCGFFFLFLRLCFDT